ncbi:MAG TPA: dihydroxyacetone kinase subunit DhaK [Candidatus Nesterenkonia stercoripullorum]|uniref:Dihydroxyacetone kinase subunit DhaK n=1 Tax=Candidatus Nesterenkonia stercoripullorum TaxID=2838701 RepID=A0A9D1S097_9MICC|nr:dihydroxyacetone kinase subunit DhaK [Candidatus Nesterenkonia stercoripullorum]
MRKIINEPETFVDEVLDGIYHAHAGSLRPASADGRALVRADAPHSGRVGIVTGGGSGHLPLFLGYVGRGLCTAAAVGNVFSSPSVQQILDASRAVEGGAGVLFLYGNYGGDVYNFGLAGDVLRAEGVPVRTVLGTDDILSAPVEREHERRGVAGLVLAYKIAGAAAERGDSLEEVARLAQDAASRTRTMGVGLGPTILPAAGEPTFELDEGEMEIGVGIHGERGVYRGALETADEITERFLGELQKELALDAGSRVAVLVNGLGATPPEELYLIYRKLEQELSGRGVTIVRRYVGEYATSLEMVGASVSIMELDELLEALIEEPAESPFFHQGSAGASDVRYPEAGAARDFAQEPVSSSGTSDLRPLLDAVLPRMQQYTEELRSLDAAVGDGDLGITVSQGAAAVLAALDQMPHNVSDRALLVRAGQEFAEANPSTFAALTAAGVLAAAETLPDDDARIDGRQALRAFTERIAARGGAQPGDKTVLDVLLPLLEESADAQAGQLAETAARLLEETDTWQNRRGRAAWQGERTKGQRDPGSAAAVHFLNELARARGIQ